MSRGREALYSGGCQCGGVRYAIFAEPTQPHLCHCRMCQKAFGSLFAALALAPLDDFVWTRGEPAIFASSSVVERGFCAACGTPLTFQFVDSKNINFSIGSLDEPSKIQPDIQIGVESRISWVPGLGNLPASRTEEVIPADRLARTENLQHPDHDTEDWSPR